MTYSLVAIFLLTGDTYVERRHMPLATCAGRLAMLRTETLDLIAKFKIEYRCVPEVQS